MRTEAPWARDESVRKRRSSVVRFSFSGEKNMEGDASRMRSTTGRISSRKSFMEYWPVRA